MNWLKDHPFANPKRRLTGRQRAYVFRDKRGKTLFIGIEDRSRWLAHQGNREIARRAQQIATGRLEVSRG